MTRLVLLPGLGADARMFEGQRVVVSNLEVPEWIEPHRRESLAGYAQRMAETIQPGGRLFLGGSSFGGMVALEMARHIEIEGVILIGSCAHPRELRRLIRWSARVSGRMPKACNSVLRLLMPCVLNGMKPGGVAQRKLLAEMSRGVSIPFIRWGTYAMVNWTGAENIDAPIFRVHGSHDHVIPVGGIEPTHVVQGAGHVPSMSHSDSLNRFLDSILHPAPL